MPGKDKSGKKKQSVAERQKRHRYSVYTPECMMGAVRKIVKRVNGRGEVGDGRTFSKKKAYVAQVATLAALVGNRIADTLCTETATAGMSRVSARGIIMGTKISLPREISRHALAHSVADVDDTNH